MKKLLSAAAIACAFTGVTEAQADTIGMSMASSGNTFLTVLKNRIYEQADEIGGIELKFMESENNGDTQIVQVQAFLDAGVDAVLLHVVNEDVGVKLSEMAAAAGIPAVFVNRPPKNVDSLPELQAFVASAERDAGRLQAEFICDALKQAGKTENVKALILRGPGDHAGAIGRTAAVKDVLATDACNFISVVSEEVASWNRETAASLVTAKLDAGVALDAVFANNDGMALGALDAFKSAGVSMDDVFVGGVDATQGALMSMSSGEMDVTVFQNAAGQGENALLIALDLVAGKNAPSKTFVPFELVTLDNMGMYFGAN